MKKEIITGLIIGLIAGLLIGYFLLNDNSEKKLSAYEFKDQNPLIFNIDPIMSNIENYNDLGGWWNFWESNKMKQATFQVDSVDVNNIAFHVCENKLVEDYKVVGGESGKPIYRCWVTYYAEVSKNLGCVCFYASD